MELAAYQTRIRLRQRQDRWPEAYDLACQAVTLAVERGDRILAAAFRVLQADAAIALDRREEAARLLAQAAEDADSTALATLADVERVTGKLLARTGGSTAARAHFARATRWFDLLGNACLRADVERDIDAVLGPQPAPATPAEPSLDPLELSGLLDLAPHPELLGREALHLLGRSPAVRRVSLLAALPSGELEVLAAHGGVPDSSILPADTGDRVVLGRARGREIAILAEPLDDVESRHAVVGMRKLLRAAVAGEELRQEARRRASLWPDDPAAQEVDGVWVSEKSREILETVRRIAATELPVLLTGETGTGKEMLARALHRSSKRAQGKFIPFNCTAVPRDMLESQLFGYRRGAFTGAQDAFPGVIRSASGGTLFLDEIGDMPLDLQPKLLRFLDSHEVHPLGEPAPLVVDVRVIVATNADLDTLVGDGRFREDLFYRLNVMRLRIPPLRERREEIPALVQFFVERFAKEMGRAAPPVDDETLEYLLLFGWPGNVRQLSSELRRAVALTPPDGVLTPHHLSPELLATRRTIPADQVAPPNVVLVHADQPLPAAVEQLERTMVADALRATGGRVEPAAKRLGISRKGLYLKRHALGLTGLRGPES